MAKNKVSVKDQVLTLLRNKDWCSCEDFEKIFPSKTSGHLSYGQRMRQLRSEGYTIIKRKKLNCMNTWEFHLVPDEPTDTPLEASVRRNNFETETQVNRQMFESKGQFAFIK